MTRQARYGGREDDDKQGSATLRDMEADDNEVVEGDIRKAFLRVMLIGLDRSKHSNPAVVAVAWRPLEVLRTQCLSETVDKRWPSLSGYGADACTRRTLDNIILSAQNQHKFSRRIRQRKAA